MDTSLSLYVDVYNLSPYHVLYVCLIWYIAYH